MLQYVIKQFDQWNLDFDSVMAEYATTGYIYICNEKEDECFVLAKMLPDDELFVFYCFGKIKNLMNKIHFIPKTISFYRNNSGKKKIYPYKEFCDKVFKTDK